MILEQAKLSAAKLLVALGDDLEAEVSIASVRDFNVWLGMGFFVGSGLAVYRGSYCFRLTQAGRESEELQELLTAVK